MQFAAFLSWLVTASLGAFMLRTWLARGGLSQIRNKDGGLPPKLIFGHATLALTGLLVWATYLATSFRPLAWVAVGILALTVGFGLSTVTLWTPYPVRRPGERQAPDLWDVPVAVAPETASVSSDVSADPLPDPPDSDESVVYHVTDEMIARLLTEPVPASRPRPIQPNPAVLIPAVHGVAAMTTLLLVTMSAIS